MSSVTRTHATEIGTQSGGLRTNRSDLYTEEFFATHHKGHPNGAGHIVQKVLELIQPESVIDVGCGVGTFLAKFQEHGIEDIQGVDGSYVPQDLLVIPRKKFMSFDLNRPLVLDRTYDLVISLEVAEHLASQSAADFIASLTRLGSIILFSAAIPYQDGTGHLNEQWPDYWANLFVQHGFVPVDALRKSIWNDQEIPFWYRQNMLFFCTEKALAESEKLAEAYKTTNADALSLVHPEMYLQCNPKTLVTLKQIKRKVGGWKKDFRRVIKKSRQA